MLTRINYSGCNISALTSAEIVKDLRSLMSWEANASKLVRLFKPADV